MDDLASESLKILLEHKLAFLLAIVDSTMTWWTTATIFSSATIGLFWLHREHAAKLPGLNLACFLIALFMLSFPIYAVFIYGRTGLLQEEVANLLKAMGRPGESLGDFVTVKRAVVFGGTTLSAAFLLWLSLWWTLKSNIKNSIDAQPLRSTLGFWGRSVFTIQVKEPNKSNFQAPDLLLFHGECGGGALKKETDNSPGWLLVCTRCNAVGRVETSAEGTSKICMTALDGKMRPIKSFSFGEREEFVAERID